MQHTLQHTRWELGSMQHTLQHTRWELGSRRLAESFYTLYSVPTRGSMPCAYTCMTAK